LRALYLELFTVPSPFMTFYEAINIEDIINAIQNNRIRITEHADDEAETDKNDVTL
jgi:hypothetical protein